YLRTNWLTAISLVIPALRIFRIFRVLRVLRAARTLRAMSFIRVLSSINRGMRAMANAMGRRGVGYVVALTAIVTFVGAAGMAYFENPAAVPSSDASGTESSTGIRSYGEAVWWTAMIMTTMGSDYWPKTVEGRILCLLLSLYALSVFGYITATIASYFIGQNQSAPSENKASLSDLRDELAALRAQLAVLAERAKQPGEGG
ncbi:MAG: ion transporter, partial [Anaerolineae bacterium]|nr:ion transporter [Anaerolineae bacterium]